MTDLPPLMPHGSLQAFADDVWILTGSVQMAPGMRIPRNMVVLRHEGELTLISAVRVDDAGRGELDALGSVRNLMKIGVHGMDDAWYLKNYPDARAWALPGTDHQPGGKQAGLLTPDSLPIPWMSLFQFEHTNKPESALVLERGGGILVTCDCVQHWPDSEGCSFLAKGLTKLMGFQKRLPVVGPPWLKAMTPAGGSLSSDFARLADLEYTHLISGHGKPMRNANAALRATVEATFA
ncbi:MAG: hypothetical protein KDA24_06835 [Deltaproteobacteria bacterium]|nr:hypothetical protein [Deltaproteobacteria bacterium]